MMIPSAGGLDRLFLEESCLARAARRAQSVADEMTDYDDDDDDVHSVD